MSCFLAAASCLLLLHFSLLKAGGMVRDVLPTTLRMSRDGCIRGEEEEMYTVWHERIPSRRFHSMVMIRYQNYNMRTKFETTCIGESM